MNMKTRLLFILGMLTTWMVVGCSKSHKTDQLHVVFAGDITDTAMLGFHSITVDGFKHLFQLEYHPLMGIELRFVTISDSRYNPTFVVNLPKHSSDLTTSEIERLDEEQRFFRQVEQHLLAIQSKAQERKQSFVYATLFKELQLLANKTGSGRKVLLFASDLAENSPSFSVFKKSDRKMLDREPEKVMEMLAHQYPMQSPVAGIQVFFIHESTSDDGIYHSSVTMLTDYLTQQGCIVQAVGSLNEINLNL